MTPNDGNTPLATLLPTRRSVSSEQRMNEFHCERTAGTEPKSFEDMRKTPVHESGSDDPHGLKAARAEAVEYVVKAFAAIDRNVSLADSARVQQQKSHAAADGAKLETEKELAAARLLRENAEKALSEARTRSSEMLFETRAKCDRMIEEARAKCEAEAAAVRRALSDSLAPLRDVITVASGRIAEFVDSDGTSPDAEAVDLRDLGVAGDETGGGGPHGSSHFQVLHAG